jgi:hypothetical protein
MVPTIQMGMSDARCLTSWLANCRLEQAIKNESKVYSERDYRMYLQDNAQAAHRQSQAKNLPCLPYIPIAPCPTFKGWSPMFQSLNGGK